MRVAVIIGWGASHLRVIRKYTPVYSEKGYETVCIHMPTRIGWWPPLANRMASNLERQLDTLAQSSQLAGGRSTPTDVVFHLFSGSSFIFLPYIFNSLERPSNQWRMRGIVHDSGPVTFSLHVCESGIGSALSPHRSKAITKAVRRLLSPFFRMVDFAVGDKHRANLTRVMSSPHTAVPQLFLYSQGDSVIHWREVEQRISEQKQRGVAVMSHRWENSEHVSHFLNHTEEYKRLVGEFLDKHIA